jgi:multidrug/hemolysin transport system permease protein
MIRKSAAHKVEKLSWHARQRQLQSLIARNLRVYFSDPIGVVLSLVGAMIVIILYILFLSDMQVDQILRDLPWLARDDVKDLMGTWLMAGASAVAAATTGLGAMITFVNDRSTGRFQDFQVSPLSRATLTLGYICATIIIAGVMTTAVFAIGVGYIFSQNAAINWRDIGLSYAALLLCIVSFSAIFGCIGSLIKSLNSFNAVSVLVAVAIGFFAGVYLPIGVFSDQMKNVVAALPFSQGAALVRENLMSGTLDRVADQADQAKTKMQKQVDQAVEQLRAQTETPVDPTQLTSEQIAVQQEQAAAAVQKVAELKQQVAQMPDRAATLKYFREYLGVDLKVGDHKLTDNLIMVILGGLAIVFAFGMTWIITKKVRD